jgi:hypothetical protein
MAQSERQKCGELFWALWPIECDQLTILNNGIRFWEARDVASLMISVASTNRSEMRCQRQVM